MWHRLTESLFGLETLRRIVAKLDNRLTRLERDTDGMDELWSHFHRMNRRLLELEGQYSADQSGSTGSFRR